MFEHADELDTNADAPSEDAALPEFDFMDPLKRDADHGEALPGLDPIVPPIPPE